MVGLIAGLLGRGKSKRKAAEMEQAYEFAAIDLLDSYKLHQTDFDSALSGMRLLIDEGRGALLGAGLGKAGRRGADNLTMVIEEQIRLLKQLESQRQSRGALMGMQALPEFAIGGQVPGSGFRMGDGMLAVLHPGEFVMRKSAVDSLGSDFLSALNRAPRFQDGGKVGARVAYGATGKPAGLTVVFNAFDGPSVAAWWRKNEGNILQVIRRAQLDGKV